MTARTAAGLVRWTRNSSCAIPLVCFPWAGAGASAYRSWPSLLPDDLEVWAARLPGRESRISDAASSDIDALAVELSDGIEQRLERRPILLGHCFGAWVAYAIARKLESRGSLPPVQLIVVAQPAPSIPYSARSFEETLRQCRGLGLIDEQILQDPEMMELWRPALEADIHAMSGFRHDTQRRLTIPITAIIGREDTHTGRAEVLPWQAETTGGFRLVEIEGDHFFSGSSGAEFVRAVADNILRADVGGVRRPAI